MERAIEHALNNRVELRIEKLQGRELQKAKDEKLSEFYPRLDFETDLKHRPESDPYVPIEIDAVVNGQPILINEEPVSVLVTNNPPEFSSRSSIELAWNVYKGGHDLAKVRETRQKIEGQNLAEAIVEKDIIRETIVAFTELLKVQLLEDNKKNELRYWQDNLDMSKQMLVSGGISNIDYQRIQLNYEEVKIEKLKIEQDLRRRSTLFLSVIGVSDSEPFNRIVSANFDELPTLKRMLSYQLDISTLRLDELATRIGSADEVVKQQRSDYLPEIDLYASYGHYGRSRENVFDAIVDRGSNDTQYGVRLRWNIFNGLKTSARMHRAIAEKERISLERIQKRLENEVSKREKEITVSLVNKKIQLAEQKLDMLYSEERLAYTKWKSLHEITELKYREAKLKLMEAETELKVLKLDYYISVIELASVGGNPQSY
ncbi:MAG: TolC family protein [Gammaproteobacteria bacterium]|nr:TolC family protein [Gammaproteobacteria bacterium]